MFLSALALSALLLVPGNAGSCPPSFPTVTFTFAAHPGFPIKKYVSGDLEVVQPTFARAYLVIAYRYLSSRPLSQSEVRHAMRYFDEKLQGPWNDNQDEAAQECLKEREKVLGKDAPQPVVTDARPSNEPYVFGSYPNCLADAFHTGASTLKDRMQRFGTNMGAIREWVYGQDLVFSDCDKQRVIPASAPENSPAWLKADRAYQQAAAYFYSGGLDAALKRFDQIATDETSPWHTIAPYLSARTLIRKATLTSRKVDQATMQQAEDRLKKILSDPALQADHRAAHKLLGFVSLRLRTSQRSYELARLLAGPRPDTSFYQDLVDYTWSLDALIGDEPDDFSEVEENTLKFFKKQKEWRDDRYRAITAQAPLADITDWIFTLQQSDAAVGNHAVARWQKVRTVPWLVAALAKSGPHEQSTDSLLAAATEIPPTSPAFTMVLYHRIRLLMERGDFDSARTLLNKQLPQLQTHLTASSLNLFLAQRMYLALDFNDFLGHAARKVIEVDEGYDEGAERPLCGDNKKCFDLLYGGASKKDPQPRFDEETAAFLNSRLPLELLQQAALSRQVPERLRSELALATWTRAVMLNKHEVARTLVLAIQQAYPQTRDLMEAYTKANEADQHYAGLFVILHYPGMRPYVNAGAARIEELEKIEDYRDNWWCTEVGHEVSDRVHEIPAGFVQQKSPFSPAFLSTAELAAGASDWQKLASLSTAPYYLTQETLQWAKERPEDPRIPEALHFAVRTTRYGCDDRDVSSLSRQAFRLLHSRYPQSVWTKKTPYWF